MHGLAGLRRVIHAAGAAIGVACAAMGVWLLWSAWLRRAGGWRLVVGWGALAAAVFGWRWMGMAWDMASAAALLGASLAGLAAVAGGLEPPRRGRAPSRRGGTREAEPPAFAGPRWRACVRALCVGPLACAAATGCATWLALRGPGGEADRLVAAGFLMPTAWAAAAVWSTVDDRLGRVVVGLALTAGLAFAAAGR